MNTSYNSNRIKKASTGILILLHYIFVGLDLKQHVTARMGVEDFAPTCQYGSHLPRKSQFSTTTLYN